MMGEMKATTMKHTHTILTALLLSAVSLVGLCRGAAAREEITLRDGWSFAGADVGLEAAAENWSAVALPHTWNALDGQSGGKYRRGVSWYRTVLKPEATRNAARTFLRFEGVSQVADVYVNKRPAGSHKGAFTAFCLEITGLLRHGEANEVLVKVDNSRNPAVAPLSGDFTVFGGIYRPVTLITTADLCVSPLDHGSRGVYVRTLSLTPEQAEIEITTVLSNGAAAAADRASVRHRILDDNGRAVVESPAAGVQIGPGGVLFHKARLTIANPQRWNGVASPKLYTVRTELAAGGEVCDSVGGSFGLRSYSIDRAKGFVLNGKTLCIRGVNKHQCRQDKGWAVSDADLDEDFALISEMGCTGVRLAHYPHSAYAYDVCDRKGLLVWAEIPLVNHITDSQEFFDNAKQQLVELICQNYNHPAIVFWSLSNEVQSETQPRFAELLRELNTLAKAEDPDRLTVLANDKVWRETVNHGSDALAFNSYPGWYFGKPDDMGLMLDLWNEASGHRGIGVSEYGAGASIKHHEQPPAKPKPGGPWHPEEWQTRVHECDYMAIAARPFVWGSFVWNMFDFASAGRNEGDTPGRNDKGLVTFDRKTRKDAFFFYKANWSAEPVLYITGRRHTPRKESLTPVKVYANAKSVTLLVNGRDAGPGRSDGFGIFTWDAVRLKTGKNLIEAKAELNGAPLADQCEWTLAE
jgi:beta-galactosidase